MFPPAVAPSCKQRKGHRGFKDFNQTWGLLVLQMKLVRGVTL